MLTRWATAADLPDLRALLRRLGLPVDGLEDALPTLLITADAGRVDALAGLEQYGASGLLRSVAVHPDRQGRGLAQQLVLTLIEEARTLGLTQVVLLTMTAGTYFPLFGFQIVPRAAVPAEVEASREFQGACPASATPMVLALQGPPVSHSSAPFPSGDAS